MRCARQMAIQGVAVVAVTVAALVIVTTADITTSLSAQSPVAISGIPDLSGTWERARSTGGTGGGGWPLHQRARALSDALDHWAYPKYDCVPATLPRIEGDNYLKRFEQHADRVLVFYEKDDVVRTIWLRGHGHAQPKVGDFSLQGHSIGWYEGGALIVETTKFTWDPLGMADSDPPIASSQQKKVTERYSRDGDLMKVDVLTEDPLILTKPVQSGYEWQRAGREWMAYNCDPELARFPVQFQPSKYDQRE